MKAESKLSRLFLISPWPLLVFLVLPLFVILSIRFHIKPPSFIGSTKPLLINNICFALFIACRFFRYLLGMRNTIRYGAAYRRPSLGVTPSASVADARGTLRSAGYAFSADGGYGEKRDLGYLGTTVMYGGLLILLSVGCWDNLRQFSGVLLDGVGRSTDLNKVESYRSINSGPLAARPATLPRMQILSQYLPDVTYPRGATQTSFILADGKAQTLILKPGAPVIYGDFEIYMTKLVFEPQIVIQTKDSTTLFDSFVRLDPLVQKRGAYSFYGLFQGVILSGGVYYQPEKSSLMVVITRGDKKVVTDMVFQVDQRAVKGDYILSCAKMGQWSEIHVVRRRHKGLLAIGGIVAVIGLMMRIAIRPQRVWLEESATGGLVRVVGEETKKLLKFRD